MTRQCHDSIAVLRQTVAAEVSISATLQATATCLWQHEGMMQICFRKGSCGVEPESDHCPHGHSPAVMTELFILVLIIIRIQSSTSSSHRNPDELQFFVYFF